MRVGKRVWFHAALAIGVSVLAGIGVTYLATREPAYAIHVRWNPKVSEAERQALRLRHSLRNCELFKELTEECDILDRSPENVIAIIQSPAVDDTHHLDRGNGSFPNPHLSASYTW